MTMTYGYGYLNARVQLIIILIITWKKNVCIELGINATNSIAFMIYFYFVWFFRKTMEDIGNPPSVNAR